MAKRVSAGLGLAAILIVLVSLVWTAKAAESPSDRYFREDHWTGADYLELLRNGQYSLQAREHAGIIPFDEGTWTQEGDLLILRPADQTKAAFRGRLESFQAHAFIVWLDESAPGLVLDVAEVEEKLRGGPPETIPYVLFEIEKERYDAELKCRYPFRFHPEMNRGLCGQETKRKH